MTHCEYYMVKYTNSTKKRHFYFTPKIFIRNELKHPCLCLLTEAFMCLILTIC